ncbi:integrase family protein [Viridibacillus arvi]|uniref:integrase family protein n=1 Tax=Viridibacillus arvi TaxID=263475 RepID=UPI003D0887EA
MKKKYGQLGQSSDITFSWVTKIDPKLEQWRSLAEDYLITVIRGKDSTIRALGKFLIEYLHKKNVSKVPAEFLNKKYSAESLCESCYSHFKNRSVVIRGMRHTESFINWVLETCFSVEDDMGNLVIPSEYHNPITADIPPSTPNSGLSESDKNTLPFRYIKQLRTMLVPVEALYFKDLTFAQNATDAKRNGGDWYAADYSLIDKNDPDCVWRERTTSEYEKKQKGLPEVVYELWSPVRTVGLYIKLLLPLRSYQIRMLDSGETDTYRYDKPLRNEAGHWTENAGSIKEGTETHPVKRGIFRKFKDPVTRLEMTGFYINTNKTADIDKEEQNKGYEVPWQFEEVLYWLAKLRNWQEKYNPIDRPTLWTQLEINHIGQPKDINILRQMGATSFLFRDPASGDKNKDKPIRNDAFNPLWHKLLLELEQCNASQEIDEGAQLKFIKNKETTYYPLHSLRVSLITAYALEGGVPMPILSMHRRSLSIGNDSVLYKGRYYLCF